MQKTAVSGVAHFICYCCIYLCKLTVNANANMHIIL